MSNEIAVDSPYITGAHNPSTTYTVYVDDSGDAAEPAVSRRWTAGCVQVPVLTGGDKGGTGLLAYRNFKRRTIGAPRGLTDEGIKFLAKHLQGAHVADPIFAATLFGREHTPDLGMVWYLALPEVMASAQIDMDTVARIEVSLAHDIENPVLLFRGVQPQAGNTVWVFRTT